MGEPKRVREYQPVGALASLRPLTSPVDARGPRRAMPFFVAPFLPGGSPGAPKVHSSSTSAVRPVRRRPVGRNHRSLSVPLAPDSHGISGVPCYSGTPQGGTSPFVYRVVTFCDGPFHGLRLGACFVTPRILRRGSMRVPRHRYGNAVGLSHRTGLGSSPFARRYWGSRGCFPFLALLRCFTSGGSLLAAYAFSDG
jgi:hypothetical protein